MIAILSLLVVLSVSILVTRIGTLALTHTGLSRQTARFQARSAFTGVGYTTSESEKLVNHPLRRRILFLMMLLGNAGIVTVISAFILGFLQLDEQSSLFWRFILLIGGIATLLTLASSQWLDRRLSVLIQRLLNRFTELNIQDYDSLLHLGGEYSIHELYVEESDWMADKTLKDLKLKDEGILVLGLTRQDGTFIGTPSAKTRILGEDTLIIYGRGDMAAQLDQRQKGVGGQLAHAEAISKQKQIQNHDTYKNKNKQKYRT
jgi:MFS family permease